MTIKRRSGPMPPEGHQVPGPAINVKALPGIAVEVPYIAVGAGRCQSYLRIP
jgi:hypothetical protein